MSLCLCRAVEAGTKGLKGKFNHKDMRLVLSILIMCTI